MDGDEIRIPLRIDTSEVADDLQAVDRVVQRLQQHMQTAYNRSPLVRRGRAPRASSIEDVGSNRQAWTPDVQRLDRQLGTRLQQIEQAAKRGALTPPPTTRQAEVMAAQQRLAQRARAQQVEISPLSLERMARVMFAGGPQVARGLMTGSGGSVQNGVASMLGAALNNPQAMTIIGTIAAAVGAGIGVSSNTAGFQRTRALVAGSMIGGPTLGTGPGQQALALMAAAQGFNFSLGTGATIAATLAMGGVTRGANVLGGMSSTMALARLTGVDPTTLAPLTAQLMGAGGPGGGGLDATGISGVYQAAVNQNVVSVDKLVDAMKALAGTAAQAARDVVGLAAVQAFVGGNINAGALLAPALSSTGSQAISQMALLGLNPQQFAQAQAHPAVMQDRIAALVKRVDRGRYGTQIAENILQSTGLVNTANMNPAQLAAYVEKMRTGTPRQAEDAAAKVYATTQQAQQDANKWLQQIAANTAGQTSALDSAALAMQNAATAMLNRQGGTGTKGTRKAPNKYGITNTAPLPGDTTIPGVDSPVTLHGTYIPTGRSLPSGRAQTSPLPTQYLPYYQSAAINLAHATGLSQNQALHLLLAQGSNESGFDPTVTSAAGAEGIAQFMPGTAKQYGVRDPYNPKQAIAGEGRYMAALIKQFHGNVPDALAAYNAGPGNYNTPAAQTYGQQVYAAAQSVTVNVTVTDRTTGGVNAKVDHSRKVTGHKSHVPAPPNLRFGHR